MSFWLSGILKWKNWWFNPWLKWQWIKCRKEIATSSPRLCEHFKWLIQGEIDMLCHLHEFCMTNKLVSKVLMVLNSSDSELFHYYFYICFHKFQNNITLNSSAESLFAMAKVPRQIICTSNHITLHYMCLKSHRKCFEINSTISCILLC